MFLGILSPSTNETYSKDDHINKRYNAPCEVDPKKEYYRDFWRERDRMDMATCTFFEEPNHARGDHAKMADSLCNPVFELRGDLEDSDGTNGQLSQSSHAPCSTPDTCLAHATDINVPSEPPKCATAEGELGVRAKNSELEVEKLREKLRRTEEELQHAQELIAKLQDENNTSIGR